MKVLIVGKGQLEVPLESAGHELHFMETPKISEMIPSLKDFDLALFHLSEDGPPYAQVLDEWKNAGEMHKVIAVSGWTSLSNDDKNRLIEVGDIPFVGNIADMNSVKRLRWSAIPSDCKETTATLAKWLVQATSYLVALDILCQGFEFAHRGDEEAGRALREEQVRETETEEWWLRCLDLPNLEKLRQHLSSENVRDDYIERIEAGFNRARSKATLKSGVGCVCNAVKEALE
jgi:hypothetical protein